jgi:hypothetical protein
MLSMTRQPWPTPNCIGEAGLTSDIYLSALRPPGNNLKGPVTFSFAKPCGTLKAHCLASVSLITLNKGQSVMRPVFDVHVLIAFCSSVVSQPVTKSP